MMEIEPVVSRFREIEPVVSRAREPEPVSSRVREPVSVVTTTELSGRDRTIGVLCERDSFSSEQEERHSYW